MFVGASNSYSHYQAVMKKLGINLQSAVDGGQVHYIDLFSAPFDYNAFDNLPLSLSVPNTFSTKLPKKLQKASFSLVEND